MPKNKKSLFKENLSYTEEANELAREFDLALEAIYLKHKENYSLREISHIAQSAAQVLESELIMEEQYKARQ